jgi:hypothetical protein
MIKSFGYLAASFVLCLALPTPSFANSCSGGGNLINNCGFSSGTTGWTTTNFTANDFVGSGALVGAANALQMGNSGSQGYATLSQAFTDKAGVLYTFSFALYNGVVGANINFQAAIDGVNVLNYSSLILPYQVFSFTFTGTGSDSISFSAVNDPYYYYLSNVSVRESGALATPEPTSFLLMGIGLASLLAVRLKKAQRMRQLAAA